MNPLGAIPGSAADIATLVSIVFVVISGGAMCVLYLRWLFSERRLRADRAGDLCLMRQLVAALDRPEDQDIAQTFIGNSTEQKIRVFSHLVQLVRGDDHDRLMRLAGVLGVPDRAIEQLRSRHAAQRVDAMRVLERFPLPRAIEALQHCLDHDRRHDVRLEAAAALARLGQVPTPRVLIDRLELRRRPVNRLHEAIIRAGASTYTQELMELARDPASGRAQPLLVEALGWAHDFAILDELRNHAGSADPEVRAAAARAARNLNHPGAASWVTPLLLDPVEHVRVQAVRTVGRLGLTEAIPILTGLSENQSWWVRTRAVEALASMRAPPPRHDIPGGVPA